MKFNTLATVIILLIVATTLYKVMYYHAGKRQVTCQHTIEGHYLINNSPATKIRYFDCQFFTPKYNGTNKR